MKYLLTALLPMVLAGCTSLGTITPDAVPQVGKIIEKETVINRVVEQSPVFYGGFSHSFGHGRGGWSYDPFFDFPSYRNNIREDIFYQYKITINKTEKLTLQSAYNMAVGQCVTVWQVPNSNHYPRVEQNPTCQLPLAKK